MNGARFVVGCVITCLLSQFSEALPCTDRGCLNTAVDRSTTNSSRAISDDAADTGYWFEPMDGLKVNIANGELTVKYSLYKRSGKNAVNRRDKKEKKSMMHRIGKIMMMIPVGMQLLRLPMEFASLKMSLLRSLLVGKVALTFVLIRALSMLKKPPTKVVIVRSPPKETHEHFYHPYEEPEDSKSGWLENEHYPGEVFEQNCQCENKKESMKNTSMKPESEGPKISVSEALDGLDKYRNWLEMQWDTKPKDMDNLQRYRDKAAQYL